jgi:hypothetical protein
VTGSRDATTTSSMKPLDTAPGSWSGSTTRAQGEAACAGLATDLYGDCMFDVEVLDNVEAAGSLKAASTFEETNKVGSFAPEQSAVPSATTGVLAPLLVTCASLLLALTRQQTYSGWCKHRDRVAGPGLFVFFSPPARLFP